jgi:hypothetical protein
MKALEGGSSDPHPTGCPKSELNIENTPSPNLLFFSKCSYRCLLKKGRFNKTK